MWPQARGWRQLSAPQSKRLEWLWSGAPESQAASIRPAGSRVYPAVLQPTRPPSLPKALQSGARAPFSGADLCWIPLGNSRQPSLQAEAHQTWVAESTPRRFQPHPAPSAHPAKGQRGHSPSPAQGNSSLSCQLKTKPPIPWETHLNSTDAPSPCTRLLPPCPAEPQAMSPILSAGTGASCASLQQHGPKGKAGHEGAVAQSRQCPEKDQLFPSLPSSWAPTCP